MQPTYWQQYLGKLDEYHQKDNRQYIKDKKVFDDALARVRKLCEDEEEFLPNMTTHIVKDEQSSFLKRKMTKRKSSRKP